MNEINRFIILILIIPVIITAWIFRSFILIIVCLFVLWFITSGRK